jgi:hypothetical protein
MLENLSGKKQDETPQRKQTPAPVFVEQETR